MSTNTETKRAPAIETTIQADEAGMAQTVTFSATSLGQSRTVNLDKLDPMIQAYALAHGIKQKAVDAAAIARNPANGASATVADKWAAVCEVLGRITDSANPQWNATREGGGTGGYLLEALFRFYEGAHTRERLQTVMAAWSKKERESVEANPRVRAILDTIRAERAPQGIDSDQLLATAGLLDRRAQD